MTPARSGTPRALPADVLRTQARHGVEARRSLGERALFMKGVTGGPGSGYTGERGRAAWENLSHLIHPQVLTERRGGPRPAPGSACSREGFLGLEGGQMQCFLSLLKSAALLARAPSPHTAREVLTPPVAAGLLHWDALLTPEETSPIQGCACIPSSSVTSQIGAGRGLSMMPFGGGGGYQTSGFCHC